MHNETDLILTAFVGGLCGGGSIMALMFYHIKYLCHRYEKSKNIMADVAALRRVEFDMEKLKVELADLNRKVYE